MTAGGNEEETDHQETTIPGIHCHSGLRASLALQKMLAKVMDADQTKTRRLPSVHNVLSESDSIQAVQAHQKSIFSGIQIF